MGLELRELQETDIEHPPASSGALVRCGETLIMYERDNHSHIPHPGKKAIFGGKIEKDEHTNLPEQPEQALIREIGEEMGIPMMRERIEMFQGTFQAESTPGRGTRIVFEIPLP